MVVTLHYVGFHPTLILGGFERIRVANPIERVYLLYDGKEDRYGKVSRYNVKRLERVLAFFKPVTIAVNPVSFTSVFTKVYAVLKVEAGAGRSVMIDVTDMPPIAAAAAAVAAMMFSNVHIYAAHPDRRGDFIPEPGTPGFDDWVEAKDSARVKDVAIAALPGERLNLMNDRGHSQLFAEILSVLKKKGRAGSIRQLIEWCGRDPDDGATKALFSRVIRELEEKGFVKRVHEGKARRVELTAFGRAFISALKEAESIAERVSYVPPALQPLEVV